MLNRLLLYRKNCGNSKIWEGILGEFWGNLGKFHGCGKRSALRLGRKNTLSTYGGSVFNYMSGHVFVFLNNMFRNFWQSLNMFFLSMYFF